MTVITNGRIIQGLEILEEHVLIFDSCIRAVLPMEEYQKHYGEQARSGHTVIDAEGCYVSPGFMDLHIHGAGGFDTMDGDAEGIMTISRTIAATGVTSFLPTTMTMSKEKIRGALAAAQEAMQHEVEGARIMGVHMEGPFINSQYKGAQNPEYVVPADYAYIEGFEDIIKIITIAPEVDQNLKFIRKIRETTGISLAIGHSDASFETASEAMESGVSRVTHLFNAMNPFNHRKPGIIGAAFKYPVYCELIADKIHTHPELFQIVIQIKGKDKMILITDSIRAGCLKEGVSELGGQKVIVKDHAARLEDGTLAGSVLTLREAVQNIYENTDLTLQEAVALATINPAKSIDMDAIKGSLLAGKDADITIFDEEFQIQKTIVEGKLVYNRADAKEA